MQINAIPLEGRIAEAGNFEVLITHADLTDAVASEAQTLTFPIADKMSVRCVRMILDEAFVDASDTANASTALIVGDGGSTNRFLTSTELNSHGTEVFLKAGVDLEYPYTTDDTVDMTFTPTSGKTLAALTAGQVRLIFQVTDERGVAQAPAA